MRLNKYYLEIAVFLCGAVVMIFELVGSRVLAPYVGASTFVWTNLIGVILGSLSLGYWWGGKIADRQATRQRFSLIIFLAALAIILMILVKDVLLKSLSNWGLNIELVAFLSALILFSPASIILGFISPYAVKLKINNLNTSGATVGNLYALSTIGSIFGTFLAGYYLIPRFGTTRLLIFIAAVLIFLAISVSIKRLFKTKVAALFFLGILLVLQMMVKESQAARSFIDVDTEYSRVFIYPGIDYKTKKPILNLKTDPLGTQSGMFLENDTELAFSYAKYYHLAEYFKADFKKTLIIGGAGYVFPRHFLKRYTNATIDVVEIDPQLTTLAKKYFRLVDDPRLKIYHADGRVFLNKNQTKYDVIFGDAFQGILTVPYQLTTQEAIAKMYNSLNEDGVVLVNIVSSIEGPKGEFLRAEYATYKNIFPQVYLFPVQDMSGSRRQNIILVALKSSQTPDFKSNDSEISQFLSHLWIKTVVEDKPILTDNLAPVDYYSRKML